jgi:geranylgeranyl diphosphate synthase type II
VSLEESILELQELKEAIEAGLKCRISEYPEDAPVIREAIAYSLDGGKRLRGAILLSLFRDLGGTGDPLPFALAMEMIQAYSLVHDDLPCMDDDDMRRGKPTCHKKFGEAVGLLTGDALLTLAFKTAAQSDLPLDRIVSGIEILAEGAGRMVDGQVLDLQSADRDIRQMYRLKTGKLFETSAKLGAVLAGRPDAVDRASTWGRSFGYSYQILDDLDDLGAEDKNTLVQLIGVQAAKEEAASGLRASLEAVQPDWFVAKLSRYYLKILTSNLKQNPRSDII